jgi:hypothetical protein
VTHLIRGAPRLGAPQGCATDRTLNRGARGNKYQWLDMRGAPLVQWCATEAQIGTPQIRVSLVVNTPMSGSRLRIRDLNFIIEEKQATLLRWVVGRFYVVRREKSLDRRLSN